MNLKTFLTEVDDFCNDSDKETLHLIIRQIAKDLDDKDRESFLNRLFSIKSAATDCVSQSPFSEETDNETVEILHEDETVDEIKKDLEELSQYFSSLDFSRVYINSEFNEYYDYYDEESEDSEYKFWDDFDLIKKIVTAFSVVHDCYEYGLFKEGWSLVQTLTALEIKVEGDASSDIYSLNPWNFSEYGIMPDGGMNDFYYSLLPFIYFNCSPEDRAKAVMSLLQKSSYWADLDFSSLKKFKNISSKERDEFYAELMHKIVDEHDYRAEHFIKELVENISSQDLLLLESKRYLLTYPAVMMSYVLSSISKTLKDKKPVNESQKKKIEALLYLICESAQLIPSKFNEKERLLQIGIVLARALKKQKELESLCLFLFSLNTSPVNYMKLHCLSDDYHKYDDRIREIYETAYTNVKDDEKKNHSITRLSDDTYSGEFSLPGYYLIKMLDGRFDEFISIEKEGFSEYSYQNCLSYKGLLLGYLLLMKKECKAKTFKFIQSDIEVLFTLNGNLAYRYDCDALTFSSFIKSLPSAETVINQWIEHTSIHNSSEEKLFEIVDENLNRLISEMLASKRTSHYGDVINWIVMLINLYEVRCCPEKRHRLLNFIATKHPGKKVFIKRLYDEGGIKLN